MAIVLPVPAVGGGWALRPVAEASGGPHTRVLAAARDGGPETVLRVHQVPHHPLRACYPFGADDLAVELEPADPDESAALLRALVPALFAAVPRCRRAIAAPDEYDTRTQDVLAAGGFGRIAEADLPGRSVVLFAAEPPALAALSTALDDMPH